MSDGLTPGRSCGIDMQRERPLCYALWCRGATPDVFAAPCCAALLHAAPCCAVLPTAFRSSGRSSFPCPSTRSACPCRGCTSCRCSCTTSYARGARGPCRRRWRAHGAYTGRRLRLGGGCGYGWQDMCGREGLWRRLDHAPGPGEWAWPAWPPVLFDCLTAVSAPPACEALTGNTQ